MQHIQACKIDIAAVHDVSSPRFGQQEVEGVNVVQLAVRDVDEARDAPAQVEQGVHLHRRLGGAKVRPWEQRQTQINGSRVQGVDRAVEIEAQVLVGVKPPRLRDQPLRKFRVDAPIAQFVGIGQRQSPHRFAKAHVIELCGLRRQTGFHVAQTLSVGQLRERHRSVLLGAGERSHPPVAVVTSDNLREAAPRQKIHHLANSVLPAFMDESSENLRRLPHAVQIDTTHHLPKTRTNPALNDFGHSVNRTPV